MIDGAEDAKGADTPAVDGSRWLRWADTRADTQAGTRTDAGPAAGTRLFCFPHAGAGPAQFVGWAGRLGPGVQVASICLPGRETRVNEPRYTRMDDLTTALAREMEPHLQHPYALFGHSLGALVAFALCHRLEQIGRDPEHLFVSSSRAPHDVDPTRAGRSSLDDEALLTQTRAFNGLPAEVLENSDLMHLVLPALRDDFELADTYVPPPGTTVRAPITALGGVRDASVPAAALRRWKELTTGAYGVVEFPGGHFYLVAHEASVLQILAGRLAGPPRFARRPASRTPASHSPTGAALSPTQEVTR